KDEITFENASSFPGPSTPSISSSCASSSSRPSGPALSPGNAECSNCKLLTMKIKILEARLAIERHPGDHVFATLNSFLSTKITIHHPAYGSAPVEDSSPVEEVDAPSKGKKVSKLRQKTAQPKETSKTSPWTIVEEVALSEYDHDFSLDLCWKILKEHSAWKQVEMPVFYAKQNLTKEVREERPIGRDQARKKKSSTSSRSEASSAAEGGIVDMVADKWKSFKKVVGDTKEEEDDEHGHGSVQWVKKGSVWDRSHKKYKKTRADSNNAGGSGSTNTGGTTVPEMHVCSYKTFMNGKPHSFKGTEGVVDEMLVKFAVCTFESRALTWWNGNVQTLGLANANQIPWSNVKAMMTTEYCPATEIQRMEQELWTLTLKGDDIEAYNNRFHELVLMCPELVSTEKKKIEKYIRGFPEGIKGNVTSSKPATLHDAINMARELIEQGVQAKALRIGDSNKRKWEDQQGNNHHQQQNQRQEAANVYVAAPTKGRGYTGNLPWCNRCKPHHQPSSCPPRCGKCHKLGHQEGECQTRIPVAGGNSLQNVTCFGCGNQGHYMREVRFGKRGKLNPRYVTPSKVMEKVGSVAYNLEFPQDLSKVHNTFHVSNLKKCYADEPLAVPLDGLHFDDKLHFVEEPLEIVGREVKRLKRSRIPLVKVRWNSKRGPEFTWEREDQFKKKYPHLFTKTAPSSSAAS
ncbi:putative reverse transcriptase domain-containing protein, partial [Tanacetum coccineum]